MIRPTKHYTNPKNGLILSVITIVLDDFIRARDANPEVPRSANELCAVQSVFRVFDQARLFGADFVHLIFDRGEPFMSCITDRMQNKKSKKQLSFLDRITHIGQSDMRDFPALQMADPFAWCISHRLQKPRHKWQNRILNHRKWLDDWLEYDQLIRVIPGVADTVGSWNLPKRKQTR